MNVTLLEAVQFRSLPHNFARLMLISLIFFGTFSLAIDPSVKAKDQCFKLFEMSIQDLAAVSQGEVDSLYQQAKQFELKEEEISWKTGSYGNDPKPEDVHHYVDNYTSRTKGRSSVVQVVRRSPELSPIEEKRNIVTLLTVDHQLRKAGIRSILIGFAGGEVSIPLFRSEPKLYGIRGEDVSFAIVSERLNYASNFKGQTGARIILKSWTETNLATAISTLYQLESTLNDLGITGDDLQYLVCRDGELILVQLDRLRAADIRGKLDLEADRELLKTLWMRAKLWEPEPGPLTMLN